MKLDISSNNIEKLPIEIKRLVNLRLLYLHFNLLRSDHFIYYFEKINLSYLTIFNNPISTKLGIRSRIICNIKTLWALDFNIVVDEEKNENFILNEQSPYRMLSSKTKLNWPLLSEKVISENQILPSQQFWLELHQICLIYQKCSFILMIQKNYKGFKIRKNLKKMKDMNNMETNKIQSIVDQWKLYVQRQKQIKSILMKQTRKNFIQLIQIYRKYKIRKYKEYIEQNAGQIIYRALKRNHEMMNNFYNYIQKGNQKFYIAKNQLKLFLIILNRTLKEIQNNQYIRSFFLFCFIILDRKIVESIIKFIQDNSFSEIPEKNNTKYLHESQIVAYRYPLNFEKYKFKRIINLLLQPAKYLKIQYSFQEYNNTSQQDTIIKKQFQDNLFKKKRQQINENEKSYLDQNELEKLKLQKQEFIQSPFLYLFKKKVNVKNIEPKFGVAFKEEELQKALKTFKRIEYLQQTLYFQFMEVYFPNKTLFKEFIKIVYIYNREAQYNDQKEQLHIFFDFDVKRMNSILKIQKVYRSYFQFKRNQSLRLNQVIEMINQTRAIKVIQRWVRNIRIQHRQTFFKEISTLISQVNTPNLYLPCDIYASLVNIQNENKNHLKFLEGYSKFRVNYKNFIVRLQFKEYQDFGSKKKTDPYQKNIVSQLKKNNVLPQWLQTKILNVPIRYEEINCFDDNSNIDYQSLQRLYKMPKYEEVPNEQTIFDFSVQNNYQKADILHLLHTGSMISKGSILGIKYIRFSFCSISEARYRMVALALKTYRFRNGTFIKLFPDYIWQSMRVFRNRIQNYIENYYKTISSSYGVKIETNVQYGQKIDERNLYLFSYQNQNIFEKNKTENENYLYLHFYALDQLNKQIKIKEKLYYILTNNSHSLEKQNLNIKKSSLSHYFQTDKSQELQLQFNSIYQAKKIQDDLINTPIYRSQQNSPLQIEVVKEQFEKCQTNSSKTQNIYYKNNQDISSRQQKNSKSNTRSNHTEIKSQNKADYFQNEKIKIDHNVTQIQQSLRFRLIQMKYYYLVMQELKNFNLKKHNNLTMNFNNHNKIKYSNHSINQFYLQQVTKYQQVQQERMNRYRRQHLLKQDFEVNLSNFCTNNRLEKIEQKIYLQLIQDEISKQNQIQKNIIQKYQESKKQKEEENNQILNINSGFNFVLKQEIKNINERIKRSTFLQQKFQVSEQNICEKTKKKEQKIKYKEKEEEIIKTKVQVKQKSMSVSLNQSQVTGLPQDSIIQQNSIVISNLQDTSTKGNYTQRKNLPSIQLNSPQNVYSDYQYVKDRKQLSLKYRHSVFPEELFPLIMQNKKVET